MGDLVVRDYFAHFFMNREDLIGRKFGRWTVVSFHGVGKNRHLWWLCRCECGIEKAVISQTLRKGQSTSCGCYSIELLKNRKTHGHSSGGKVTPEYESWRHAKRRCFNKKDKRYNDYGGRGITMYPEWADTNGFAKFYEYMGPKPGPEYSLDRWPDNDTGNYEPGNVRWGTDEEQRRNKRNNNWIEHEGRKMIMSDWARELGMTPQLFWQRLKIWSMKEIVTKFKK